MLLLLSIHPFAGWRDACRRGDNVGRMEGRVKKDDKDKQGRTRRGGRDGREGTRMGDGGSRGGAGARRGSRESREAIESRESKGGGRSGCGLSRPRSGRRIPTTLLFCVPFYRSILTSTSPIVSFRRIRGEKR